MSTGALAANRIYLMVYDGTYWQIVGDLDTSYTHPTTAGNKHIPSGGAANQILTYSASGTAAWSGICNAAAIDVVTGYKNSADHPTVAYKTGRTKALVMAWTESASSSAYSNFLSHLFTQMSSSTSTSYSSNFCFLGVTNGNIQFPSASAVNYMVIWFN